MGSSFHTPFQDSVTTYVAADMNAPLSTLDRALVYMKNVIVHCDGAITYDSGTGVLTWASILRILFNKSNGQAVQNVVPAGNVTLANNEFAYVDLGETDGSTGAVAKVAVTTGTSSNFIAYNRIVLGYRNSVSGEMYPVYLRPSWSAIAGSSGSSGTSGTSGEPGSSGTSGTSGEPGSSGTSGTSP